MARINVIVPVYNIAKHLPRFFESILAQSFSDFRLMVFDDGSEDNSLDICEKYAKKDDRIEIYALPHGGITKVRNTAISKICCEFTVFADGDDYVEPDYLKNLIDAINETNADLVISNVIYNTDGSDHIDATFPYRGFQNLNRSDFKDYLPNLTEDRRLNYLYAKIYRSQKLKAIKIDDGIKIGEDTMINFEYLRYTNRIVTIDNADYHYIKYKTRSITSQYDRDSFKNFCIINDYIYNSLDSQDLLSDKMIKVLDARIFQSAIWVIDRILPLDISFNDKAEQISEILNSEQYLLSYKRQKNSFKDFRFDVISPQSGKVYLKSLMRHNNSLKRRAKILSFCPRFIVEIYRKLKGNI